MAKKLKFKWWYLIILVVAAIIIYKLAGGDLFAAFSMPGGTTVEGQCIQERADERDICNTLTNGEYRIDNATAWAGGGPTAVYDGIWTTSSYGVAKVASENVQANLYVTYMKPLGVQTVSKWRVASSNAYPSEDINIPSDCWNYNSSALHFKMMASYGPSQVALYCYNGAWKQLRQVLASPANLYEEAMIWNITKSAVVINEGIELVSVSSGWLPTIPKIFDGAVSSYSSTGLATGTQTIEFNIVSAGFATNKNVTSVTIITNDGWNGAALTSKGTVEYHLINPTTSTHDTKYSRSLLGLLSTQSGSWDQVQFYQEICTLNTANASNACVQISNLNSYISNNKLGLMYSANAPTEGAKIFELDYVVVSQDPVTLTQTISEPPVDETASNLAEVETTVTETAITNSGGSYITPTEDLTTISSEETVITITQVPTQIKTIFGMSYINALLLAGGIFIGIILITNLFGKKRR